MAQRKPKTAENIMLKRMVSVARSQGETGDSTAARTLHRRSATRGEGIRAKRFTEIERGSEA